MTRLMRRSFCAAAAVAFLLIGSALAQSVPPPSSPLPRVTPEEEPKIAPPIARPPAAAPSPAEADQQIEITAVQFDGATRYSDQDLQARFAGLLNTKRPLGDFITAVRQLEADYHTAGFFLTRVWGTAEASPAGTILKVRILEGYIDNVKLDGDVGPAATLVYGYLQHLTEAKPLDAATLERYVLLAKNIPGITVEPILRPMKDVPGAVELVAKLERKPVDATLSDDNRGPSTVGPNEMLATVSGNAFTSLGDRTTLTLFNTPFDNEELFGQIAEDLLLGTEGIKLSGYLGYGVLEPGSILRPAQYKSRILLAGLSLEDPIIRSRALSTYLLGAFDVSNAIVDEQDFTPTVPHRVSKDDLRIFRVGVRVNFQDTLLGPALPGANIVEFKAHAAADALFGGTTDATPFPARPREQYDFKKLTARTVRTQDLYQWPVTKFSLETGIAGQWTDDILPPSEKFFLGGLDFGRGFYNGEVTGDRAVTGKIQLQLDDQFTASAIGETVPVDLRYYGFYDIGQIWDIRSTGDPSYHIESIGIGTEANLTEHLTLQLEGVQRFTLRPSGENTAPERERAVFFSIVTRY
jgi:hemolysin activation/secretion protein